MSSAHEKCWRDAGAGDLFLNVIPPRTRALEWGPSDRAATKVWRPRGPVARATEGRDATQGARRASRRHCQGNWV